MVTSEEKNCRTRAALTQKQIGLNRLHVNSCTENGERSEEHQKVQEGLGKTPHESDGCKETQLLWLRIIRVLERWHKLSKARQPLAPCSAFANCIYHMFDQAFMQGFQTLFRKMRTICYSKSIAKY